MTPEWALMELESSVHHASEVARANGRWDVLLKVEAAARIVREAVALERSAAGRDEPKDQRQRERIS